MIKTENKTLLTNKPIPPELESRANELLCGAMPLMSVVGDLKLNGRYGNGAILVCADRLIAVSKELESDGFMILFEDIEEAYVINPLLKIDEWFLSKFESLQSGNIQSYIKYGLIFLVIVIIGSLFIG